jgi:phospholipid/cholesterol/gamma-HCH transport system substrate-binding protein
LENKARYTLVGLFIIVFLVSLVAFILWQTKYNFKDAQSYEYRLYTQNSVAGLNKNSFVEYKGLNIGIVSDIRIDPENLQQIEIVLKIDNPSMIKENSFATIQSQGITGNKNIEIGGGTAAAKDLLPQKNSYEKLPLEQSFLDNLTASAQDITQNINLTLYQINKLLKDSNIKHIDSLLSNLEKNSNNFNKTLDKLNTILDTNVPNTLANIDTLTKEWSRLSQDIRELVNKDITKLIHRANTTLDSTTHLEDIFLNIEHTIEKVDSTLDNLNENGGDIIFKTRDIKYGPQEMKYEKK